MRNKRWIAGLILSLGVTAAASGQNYSPEDIFQYADKNHDEKLSKQEFLDLTAQSPRLKDPQVAEKFFAMLDTNHDGVLSLEEYKRSASMRARTDTPAAGKRPATTPEKPTTAPPAVEKVATADELAFFEKKIRPVLAESCYKCHSAQSDKIKGGLALDTKAGIRKGGDTGPAVVPGNVSTSLLIKAVHQTDDDLKMPPKGGKLSDAIIADLEKWVAMGAPDPRTGSPTIVARSQIDIQKGKQFWAFQPPKKTALPAVKDSSWAKTDIDRFLAAGREKAGLKPVADADRRTLARRVYIDLTGLPPTPQDSDAFVNDHSPDAFEKLVDRLLASPAFGERWGRHWLDVARYAESSGKQVNVNYPHAWRYRDYVIDSFNQDKPYDKFVCEQIAGDLMPAANARQRAEQTVATGYLALGPKSHNERVTLQFALDLADEQIDAMAQGVLGLTIACARCHDHKFDPIPQKDYYSLAGIFLSTDTLFGTVPVIQNNRTTSLIELPAGVPEPAAVEKLTSADRAALQRQIDTLAAEKTRITAGQSRSELTGNIEFLKLRSKILLLEARIGSFDEHGNPKPLAMGTRDKLRPSDSPVYARGEIDKPGEIATRGFPQVLTNGVSHVTGSNGSGRLELAAWLTSPQNPLTARVWVNRAWLHLFGRGIVPTPDNFGAAGNPPSNLQLLDYLAVRFMDPSAGSGQAPSTSSAHGFGWSTKKLVREMVLSRAYQLSSRDDAKNEEVDPENALVWRMSKRRLEAEVVRDSMLMVSGQLQTDQPAGSIMGKAGDGLAQTFLRYGALDAKDLHRSVYLPIIRDLLPESLALFDFAEPSMVSGERATTTVPAQSLYLLNSPFVIRAGDEAASRLIKTSGDDQRKIGEAYLRFFQRPATQSEVATAKEFLEQYAAAASANGKSSESSKRDAWTALCQAFLASADFMYVE